MTEDEVRRIVMSMKGCLDPSHLACERCSPGFDERVRKTETMIEMYLAQSQELAAV